MKKIAVFSVLLASLVSFSASAAPIILFNTGTDASNLALPGGNGVVDTHYTILSSTASGFAGNQAVTYFNNAYAANDANSKWISLSATGTPGSNTTTYRTTFDLTGLNPLTAVITGRWGADNNAVILLNGVATGISSSGQFNYGSLVNFTINGGFVAGLNTLDFRVTDLGEPTALRVDDLVGTASVAVPEPATWGTMLLGFGVLGAAMRRRKSQISLRYI